MKKVLFYVGCALFVASMASCGNKNAEPEVCDSAMDTTVVVEEPVVEEVPVVEEAPVAVDNAAMMSAAKEAGQAKCNCYKTDPASVEKCIRALLSEKYAAYQNNTDFKAAMEAEYNKCIKEKATAKAKEVGNEAVKAGAEAISKKLNSKKN